MKYVRKIFRKTNICNPLIRIRSVRIKGLEMLGFRKTLRTYLMDGPIARYQFYVFKIYI